MIIPVTKEYENLWAELCAKLWTDKSADYFINNFENGQLKHEFLYMRENKAIALLSLSLRHDYVEGTESCPVGYVEGLFVEPSYRKMGIAKELIAFAKSWSKEKGCTELASDCEIENDKSRIFHNSIGFEEAGVIVCFKMKI